MPRGVRVVSVNKAGEQKSPHQTAEADRWRPDYRCEDLSVFCQIMSQLGITALMRFQASARGVFSRSRNMPAIPLAFCSLLWQRRKPDDERRLHISFSVPAFEQVRHTSIYMVEARLTTVSCVVLEDFVEFPKVVVIGSHLQSGEERIPPLPERRTPPTDQTPSPAG